MLIKYLIYEICPIAHYLQLFCGARSVSNRKINFYFTERYLLLP
jgi:hypothetical protein